ncbi:unnamed protein product [Phytophthora lilii]|uniref:Unnamed protein product n=1 Tax=Phytophthora lilii TaxID=2077276 RepID=A0A9W6TQ66_9STRA|nr:unnamed protein product [Phytophthora lilii]
MMDLPLDDETLQRVYAWIDEIPLSRPKKSISRDFSDGILAAEVVAFYFPKLVQMHNYSAANSIKQKQYNWNTLNREEHLPSDNADDTSSVVSSNAAVAGTLASGSPISGSNRGTLQTPIDKLNDSRGGDPLTPLRDLSMQDTDAMGGYMEPPAAPVHPMDSIGKSFLPSSEISKSENVRQELAEKDSVIAELRETAQILEMKVQKLEQLVRLKDGKIQTLVAKLRSQKPQA